MKKIIILGIVLITTILSSCNNSKINNDYPNNIEFKSPEKFIKFEYDGHKYIVFQYNFIGIAGVVHDPDCPCNKKD